MSRCLTGFWRKCRLALRLARFVAWAAVLGVLGAMIWFNLVGLPGFLKTRLVTALHERGVQLEFSRMRLRFVHGLICDNVRVGATQETNSPVLTVREVQIRVNFTALLHRRLQVDGLVLHQGNLNIPLAPGDTLALTNLECQLRFEPNDTWTLDEFHASLAGARFALTGEIEHAPEFRHWKMFSAPPASITPADRGSVQASLKSFSDTLKQIHFDGQPELNARLNGDAREVRSLILAMNIRAPGVQTPWFSVHDLKFAARVGAAAPAPAATDPAWGFWTNLQPFHVEWTAHGTDLNLDHLDAAAVDCDGGWTAPGLSITKFSAVLGGGALDASAKLNVATRELNFNLHSGFDPHAAAALLASPARRQLAQISWTAPPRLRAEGSLVLPPWTGGASDWQTNLAPRLRLQGELAFTNTRVAGFPRLDSVHTHFSCTNRVWQLPDLAVVQGRTALALSGWVDEAAQNFHGALAGRLDAASVQPFLTTSNAARGFAYLTFREPVALALDATGNLRDLAALVITGRVAATNFAIRGLPVDSFTATFNHARQIWDLPGLSFIQGKTVFELSGRLDEATQNFHGTLAGRLDADSVRPFLPPNAARGFAYLTFREPVALSVEAAGNLRQPAALTATGYVAAVNFAIRNQWLDRVAATFSYSNLTAEFYQPKLERAGGAEQFAADRLTLDLAGERLFLRGGAGHVSPTVVAAAIGPKTAEAMAPYQFLAMPEATVNGCIPLKHEGDELVTDDADLRFDVVGTAPFRWRRFQTPAITGTIHWLANDLILTNVVSECYGGRAHGWGVFDVQTPGDGTDFSFFMAGTNVDFHAMGCALWSPTNQLRGWLTGSLNVTRANSSDWRTWDGYGHAELREGLLWDAPIFGLMSPVLNTITPGLDVGSSRATDGAGSCIMTNGVIFTDTLEIRSLTMRLNYVGTVDLEENVSARVQAQLLRNTPLLGSLFSVMLLPVSKAFECDVAGTLDQPRITPVYIPFPKVLGAPLHPIRTVEEIFSAPATNSPAKP